MAKITGALTGWKGKVGNMVFAMWKGVQVVKTRTIPTNPQSTGQTAQRGVFGDIVSIFKTIASGFIRSFWNPFVTQFQSGWGNFLSANLLAMGNSFDITKAIMAQGSLDGVSIATCTYDDGTGEIEITWGTSSPVNGEQTDVASVVVYNDDTREVVFASTEGDSRADEATTVTIATGLTATDLHAFLIFSTENPTSGEISACSDSQYQAVAAAV